MARRPQPDRRRGLLRATGAVVVLVIILFVIIFIVSALTAPSVKAPPATAPVPPATPGKSSGTPGRVVTTGTIVPKVTPTKKKTPGASSTPGAKPTAAASATPAPKPTVRPTGASRDVAFGREPMAGRSASPRLIAAAQRLARSALPLPRWTATFAGTGNAYQGRMLVLRDRVSGRRIAVGRADPFVWPVWSARQTSILFVRVRQTLRYPGARWTLWQYDVATRHARRLTSTDAMQMTPLGWQGNSILLSIARETTTGYYLLRRGAPAFQAILWAQPIANPTLSLGGRFITFVSPSDCVWCPVIIFDRHTTVGWYGPSGVPDEHSIAWTDNGSTVVVRSWHSLLAINATSHTERRFALPAGLPIHWADPMAARVSGSSLVLQDQRTGRRFTALPTG